MSFPSSTSSSRRALLAFGAVFAAAYASLEALGLPRPAFYGGQKLAEKMARLVEFERGGAARVLFLGASFVDQGIDPASFESASGVRAFNLGVSGTDLYFQSVMVRELLLSGRRPEAILWGLRDELQWASDINHQYLAAPASVAVEQGGLAFRLARHVPSVHRRRLFDWARLLGLLPATTSVDHVVDAFGLTRLSAAPSTGRRAGRAASRNPEVPRPAERSDFAASAEEVRAHVEETLRRAKAAGVAVWFLFTPYLYVEENFARSSQHALAVLTRTTREFDWLVRWAAEDEIPLLDMRYCAEFSHAPELFHDSRHLNAAGAEPMGRLLGELYSGRRTIPDAWRGALAPAQIEAILGPAPTEIPVFAVGRAHPLSSMRPGASSPAASLHAELRIETAGRYRLVLRLRPARAHPGTFFVRLGPGPFTLISAGRAVEALNALEAELGAGPNRLELHSRTGEPIPWDEFAVLPIER